MKTCQKCSNTIPNRMVVDGKLRILHRRKYCLSCSPFNQHNTTKLETKNNDGTKLCPRCDLRLPTSSFYNRRDSSGQTTYCKLCAKHQSTERQRMLKKQCVDYKGGKCHLCNYAKCTAAMDFHHKDRSQKDFGISYFKRTAFNEKMKKELDKCVLLCCRCHREVEAGIVSL